MAFRLQDEAKLLKGLFKDLVSPVLTRGQRHFGFHSQPSVIINNSEMLIVQNREQS